MPGGESRAAAGDDFNGIRVGGAGTGGCVAGEILSKVVDGVKKAA